MEQSKAEILMVSHVVAFNFEWCNLNCGS